MAYGIPPLPRSANIPPVIKMAAGLLQSALILALQSRIKWGIYDQKGKVLGDPSKISKGWLGAIGAGALSTLGLGTTTSTSSVDYSKEMKVSDFPIERGSFASYNKVELPATPMVTLAFTGKEKDRTVFLAAIDKACKSNDLYNVVTPEVTYKNYSIERYAYQRRHDRGATLLLVEISLKEIRQVSVRYTKTVKTPIKAAKKPAATPPADSGKAQPKAPLQSTLKKIAGWIGF
jgi:hypothetical protein